MTHFVELDNVTLRYGGEVTGTVALKGATLRVQKGEFVAVVGPSGCGKSTLMKARAGLWPVNRGNVVVAGREVKRPVEIVGMAFQNATLLPWRTTLDNVMLPLEIVEPHRGQLRRNRAEYEAKARDLLAYRAENRCWTKRSKSDAQMLRFARGIIRRSTVLRDFCDAHGLRYFDLDSSDFDAERDRIVRAIERDLVARETAGAPQTLLQRLQGWLNPRL